MNRAAIALAALVLREVQGRVAPPYRDDFDRVEPQRKKGVTPKTDKRAKIKAARKQRAQHR